MRNKIKTPQDPLKEQTLFKVKLKNPNIPPMRVYMRAKLDADSSTRTVKIVFKSDNFIGPMDVASAAVLFSTAILQHEVEMNVAEQLKRANT